MSRVLLENGLLLDPEQPAPMAADLLLEAGVIADRLPRGAPRPAAVERFDLHGLAVAPGFIDLHFHGASVFGAPHDAGSTLRHDASSQVRHGTTAFLATTVAASRELLAQRVASLAAALEEIPGDLASPLGIHLEGPWISPEAAGAQPAEGIRDFEAGEWQDLAARAGGAIRMVTLAPERPGADSLLVALARGGVLAALGHSLADHDAVARATAEGARHVTHLFNAMAPIHHRSPGLAGAALADERLSCDLICDGAHVHAAVVRLAARAKGDGLLLISDRLDPDPRWSSGDFGAGPVHTSGGALRLADGRLAGSCLTLDRAVANLQRFASMTRVRAVAACTLGPARLLGIEAQRGTLRPGARADLALLDAQDRVIETWIGGRRVFRGDPVSA